MAAGFSALKKGWLDTGISTTANIDRSNLRGDIGGLMAAMISGRVMSLIAGGKSKESAIGIVFEAITISLVIGVLRLG